MAYIKTLLFFLITYPSLAFAADEGRISGIKQDQEIEITAEQLTVLQKEELAIFTGSVEAIQGDARLKSDKMVVHYAKGKNEQLETPEMNHAINKMDVVGNVKIDQQDQHASGNKGTYFVADEKLELNGNVVLNKGGNIIKGEKLLYNMKTGQSDVFAGKNDQTPGRVKALVIPKKKNKDASE